MLSDWHVLQSAMLTLRVSLVAASTDTYSWVTGTRWRILSGNCALVTRKDEIWRLCSSVRMALISGYMIGSPTKDSAQCRTYNESHVVWQCVDNPNARDIDDLMNSLRRKSHEGRQNGKIMLLQSRCFSLPALAVVTEAASDTHLTSKAVVWVGVPANAAVSAHHMTQ